MRDCQRDSGVSRRRILSGMAALPALVTNAAPQPRYKLGVMAGMYSSVPLDEAMQRIRKSGYRYISMAAKHGNDIVYSPDLPKPERFRMLRRIRDLGMEPFLSLGGFGGDPETAPGLEKYMRCQLPILRRLHVRNPLLGSAAEGHAEQAGQIEVLIVKRFAVERLTAPPATISSHLDLARGAIGRHFPDLLTSGSIRREIDPLAVSRPISAGIIGRVCCHPPRRPALRWMRFAIKLKQERKQIWPVLAEWIRDYLKEE